MTNSNFQLTKSRIFSSKYTDPHLEGAADLGFGRNKSPLQTPANPKAAADLRQTPPPTAHPAPVLWSQALSRTTVSWAPRIKMGSLALWSLKRWLLQASTRTRSHPLDH